MIVWRRKFTIEHSYFGGSYKRNMSLKFSLDGGSDTYFMKLGSAGQPTLYVEIVRFQDSMIDAQELLLKLAARWVRHSSSEKSLGLEFFKPRRTPFLDLNIRRLPFKNKEKPTANLDTSDKDYETIKKHS